MSQLSPCLTRAACFPSHAGEQWRASVLYILMRPPPSRYKAMVLSSLPNVLVPVVLLAPPQWIVSHSTVEGSIETRARYGGD